MWKLIAAIWASVIITSYAAKVGETFQAGTYSWTGVSVLAALVLVSVGLGYAIRCEGEQ